MCECQCVAPLRCESNNRGKGKREGKKRDIITCFMFIQTNERPPAAPTSKS